MTRGALAVVLAALALALAPGCRRKPVTQEECDRLLDRYVEMQIRIDEPKARAATIENARVEARALALKDRAFRSCTSEVTRDSMDCALAAWDADQIERCLIPMP